MNWLIETYDAVLYDKKIWFSNNNYNGLFYYDIDLQQAKYVAQFPQEPVSKRMLHKRCFLYTHYLIFLPSFSDYIHIYDIQEKSFITLFFEGKKGKYEGIADAVLIENSIYMISCNQGGAMFQLMLDSFELRRIHGFKEKMSKFNFIDKERFVSRCTRMNNKIVFAVLETNKVVEWDVCSESATYREFHVSNLFSATYIDNKLWLLSLTDSCIFSCDADGNETRYESEAALERGDGKRFYSEIVSFDNEIYVIPSMADRALKLYGNSFKTISGTKYIRENTIFPAFLRGIKVDDMLVYLPFSVDGFYIYKLNENTIKKANINVSDSDKSAIRSLMLKELLKNNNLVESDDFGLKDLVISLPLVY